MNNNNEQQFDKSKKDDIEKIKYKSTGFPAAFSTTEAREQQPRFSSVKLYNRSNDMSVSDQRLTMSMPSSLETLYRKPSSRAIDSKIRQKQETKVPHKTSKPMKWTVDRKCLETLMDDFPLERTSRLICDVDASTVASRICDCLRERSVQTTYNNNKAKAKCVTVDNVKFRIQLFASECGNVMVEVQRRKGEGFIFMRECRAILNAASGDGSSMDEPTGLGSISGLKCIKNANCRLPNPRSEVDHVERMMLDRQEDTSRLALALLRDMTDPVKSSADIVETASRRVFDKSSETCRNLLKRLETGASETTEKKQSCSNTHAFQLQLVLNIMSNALVVMKNLGQLSRVCHDGSMQGIVIPILLKLVNVGEMHPHISYFAIKCISCLSEIYALRLDLLEADIISILRDAADIGLQTHENLGRVAENTLLQCSR